MNHHTPQSSHHDGSHPHPHTHTLPQTYTWNKGKCMHVAIPQWCRSKQQTSLCIPQHLLDQCKQNGVLYNLHPWDWSMWRTASLWKVLNHSWNTSSLVHTQPHFKVTTYTHTAWQCNMFLACTVVSRKRAHYGLSAHPPVLPRFLAEV